MLFPTSCLTPLTTIYRTREMHIPGTVLRRVGEQVIGDTVVAEAEEAMGYRLFDLEKLMGVRIVDARKVLLKERDNPIEKGEVIARAGMLVKAKFVSPVAGKIIDARGSKVLIQVNPRHIALTAFYPGKIINMIPERGVVLEVTGAVVQGMWGMGRELRGRIQPVSPDGHIPMQADQITAQHVGAILLGGQTVNADALAQAVQNKVGAIVVGSVRSDFLPAIREASVPLILTEGLGDLPMNPQTFDLLRSCQGREACFNPLTEMRWRNCRPEIVIPLPASAQEAVSQPSTSLQVGTRVRVLQPPYQNAIGQVVSLPPYMRRIESGMRAYGAEVDLEPVGKAFIPFENLEILC